MSKDPAFLLYHQDFFTGVSDMTNEEVGAYILCLCVQASKNGITEKHMFNICQRQDIHNVVKEKFVFNDEGAFYQNTRLKVEIEKRKKYSESRSTNRKSKVVIPKTNLIHAEHMINICQTYDKHMEDEDEIENIPNVNITLKEKGVGIFENINFDTIVGIFNTVCFDLNPITTITEIRKQKIKVLARDFGLEKIGEVFKKSAASDYMNGKLPKSDWKATFDWIIQPDNFIKILEDNYKNSDQNAKSNPNIKQNYVFDLERATATASKFSDS